MLVSEKILSEESISELQYRLTNEQLGHLNAYRRTIGYKDAKGLQSELEKYPGRPFSLKNLAWIMFVGHEGFKDYLYEDLHRQAILKEIESRALNAGAKPQIFLKSGPSPAPC